MPEQTPIWKREIRLGRRRAAPPPPGPESEAPTVAGDAGQKVDAAASEPPVETPVTPSEALAVTVDPVPAAAAEPAPAVAVEPADQAPVAASSPVAIGPAVTVVSGPDPVEAGPEARPAPVPAPARAPVPVNGVVSLPQPTADRAGLLTEEEQFCPDVDRALMPKTEDEQLAQLDALLAQLNSRQLLATRPPTSVAPQSATSPRGEPHADLVVHPAEPIATADPVPLPVPEPAQPLPPAAAEPVPPARPEPVPAVDVEPASTAEPEPVPAPQAEVVAPESEAEADVVAPEPEPQVAVPASEDAVATEARSSLLRREIHFGRPRLPRLARKRKTEKPAVESLPPAVARLLEPESEVIVAPEPAPANEVEAALMADLADALAFELEPDGVAPEPEPQVAVPAPERAVEPQAKRSLVRREFSFGRPRLPRLARNLKAARPAAESLKAASAKLAAWWRSTQIRLRTAKGKSLRLPSLRLRLTLPFELPFGAGREQTATASGASTIVGLRVGSSQLAAALVHNNGSAELAQLARTPLERGIVVGGEVRDPTALARALKVFFAEHKLPHKGVRLGIANNRIGVRVLDVPAVKDPNLMANAIRFRAQEVMPFPMAEAVLDQVVLGDPIGKGLESTQKVLIVFAHRNLVDRYVEACSAAGLKLVGIDFDAFALLRAVSDVRREDEEAKAAVIAVALGQERTIFAVSDGRICDFARVLEWGGGALDSALADALELSPLEAQQLKQTLSLTGGSGHPELSEEQLEKARAVLRQELQVLARELVTSLQFYQSRPESLDIGEVLLSGGGAELVGIDAELGRMLGVPVRVADPLARVTLSGDVRRPAEPGSLAIAIGLGIEEQH